MSAIVKYGVGGIAVVGMAIMGNASLNKQRASAVEQFSISAEEASVMDTCEKAFSRYNIEFKSGVDRIVGCGCMTRFVADEVDAGDLPAASAVIAVSIQSGSDSVSQVEHVENLLRVQEEQGLSGPKMQELVTLTGEAVAHCARHESYMSEADIAHQQDVEAEKIRKTEDALDRLVAEGHMTREEADRRLAGMRR